MSKVKTSEAVRKIRKTALKLTTERADTENEVRAVFSSLRDAVRENHKDISKIVGMIDLAPVSAVSLLLKEMGIEAGDATKKDLGEIVKVLSPFTMETLFLIKDITTDEEAADMFATFYGNTISRAAATLNDVSNIVERMAKKHDLDERINQIGKHKNKLATKGSQMKLMNAFSAICKRNGVTEDLVKGLGDVASPEDMMNALTKIFETFFSKETTKVKLTMIEGGRKTKAKKAKKASPEQIAARNADPLVKRFRAARDAANAAGVNVWPRARRTVDGKRKARKIDHNFMKSVIEKAQAKGLKF